MSAEDFVSRIAEGVFVLLAVIAIVRAVHRPRRVKIHTAAFFGMVGLLVLILWTRGLGVGEDSQVLRVLALSLLVALPYPLLALAGDFVGVPSLVKRAAGAAMLASVVGMALVGEELPDWFVLLVVTYFVATTTYSSAQFTQAAVTMRGVSRMRMGLAAAGSLALGGVLLVTGFGAFSDSTVLDVLRNALILAAGLTYYVGFAMPGWLKSAIQSSHLRRFLAQTTAVAPAIYRQETRIEVIESSVAEALGTPHAQVMLWDEDDEDLRAFTDSPEPESGNPRSDVVMHVYATQEAHFTEEAGGADPDGADASSDGGSDLVLLAAPITLDDRRFGVLMAFGGLPPFLHDDDLSMLEVMATQVAVILSNAELLEEVTRAHAREETIRRMDDFFAAAAHDLKTPLTTILGQGQRVQRQISRGRPIDPDAIDAIVQQAVHMRRLVEDILDDARERGSYIGDQAPADLVELAQEVASLAPQDRHELSVLGEPTQVVIDRERMRQVLTNLVENAVKYSPDGGSITIQVGSEEGCVCLAVTDQGIGIPPADRATIFERFSRGSREPDRRFSGLGLGLYTCRRIVEEHGGTIDVESRLGVGSTFTVRLPARVEAMPIGEA